MFSKFSPIAVALAAGAVLLGGPLGEVAPAQTGALEAGRVAARPQAGAEANYQTLYVNPEVGDDSAAGLEAQPLRTVTRALEVAPPNTVIVLAPGRYSQRTGEVFPLQLKPGVTIQGAPSERDRTAIIEGGGQFVSPTRSQQNAAIVAADRAGIAQIAVSNPDGYGVWVESASPTILETAFVGNRQTGLYVASGSPRVQGSYFSGNQVAGLIVLGRSTANIQQNIFDSTGDAIRVLEGATPEIVGNRMTNNDAGLVVIGDSRPVVRDNQMVNNRRNDVVTVGALSEGRPNGGTPVADAVGAGRDAVPEAMAETGVEEVAPEAGAIAFPEEAADAVPGERQASFRGTSYLSALPDSRPTRELASLPTAQLPVGSVMLGQPTLEADAVPGELSPNFNANLGAANAPTPDAERSARAIPVEVVPAEPVAIAAPPVVPANESFRTPLSEPPLDTAEPDTVELEVVEFDAIEFDAIESVAIESVAIESVAEPDMVALGSAPSDPLDGAPGAALNALQSGLALGGRAANDGNTNSPSLLRNRRRRRPDAAPGNEVDARRPAPPPVSSPTNNNRLAVPDSDIPLGSGASATVFSAPSSGAGAPPAPPSRAQALGLYYRVFVEASDPFVQDGVRDVVPDAFRTRFEGRTVMQVGAFPTEEEAEDRLRLLEGNGFDARMEYIR